MVGFHERHYEELLAYVNGDNDSRVIVMECIRLDIDLHKISN